FMASGITKQRRPPGSCGPCPPASTTSAPTPRPVHWESSPGTSPSSTPTRPGASSREDSSSVSGLPASSGRDRSRRLPPAKSAFTLRQRVRKLKYRLKSGRRGLRLYEELSDGARTSLLSLPCVE